MSPEQQALYAAVVASPDDDLPRLVYADWLEEHGDADWADLIRVQCARRNGTPDLPEYFDLRERERELYAVAAHRLAAQRPSLPAGFAWTSDERGFPYQITHEDPIESLHQVEKQLERIAAVAPVRGLTADYWLLEQLVELIHRPVCERFERLEVAGDDDEFDVPSFTRALASSGHVRRLTDLDLTTLDLDDRDFATLAGAKTLARLDRLNADWRLLTRRSNAALRDATWRASLTNLSASAGGKFPIVAAGVAFPRLHTLVLDSVTYTPGLIDCLNNTGNYPRLAELTISGETFGIENSRVRWKPLTRPLLALELQFLDFGAGGFRRAFGAAVTQNLRRLHLMSVQAGADWPAQLAAIPFTRLRVLELLQPDWAGGELGALAEAEFWSTLTEVEFGWHGSDVPTAEWGAFFAGLNAPALRRLTVTNAKVQARGVAGLVANRSLTTLRTLELKGCGVGEKAARTLLTAPQFQRLVILDLSDNRIGDAPEVLTDPGVLPTAKLINLGEVKVTPAVARKLRKRPEVRFTAK
jgi:uncharacterized protein (TIGR02996 family)